MLAFFSVLCDILHVLKIIYCCETFFLIKKRGKDYLMLLACFATLFSVFFIAKNENVYIDFFVYLFSISLLLCCIYKEKRGRLLFFSFWLLFVLAMLDMISDILVGISFYLICIDNNTFLDLVQSLISLLFILLVGKLYNKKYRIKIQEIKMSVWFFFTILIISDTCVVTILYASTWKELKWISSVMIGFSLILVILGIFFQLATVILLYMQKNIYKEKEELTEKYLNDQISHYEYLEKREKETKKFRHDLRSHMQLLAKMIEDKEYDKFDEYLKDIDIKIESFANVITVHNGIVDAILNQYYAKATQLGIDFQVVGMIPEHCGIEAFDLCTIVSNVISNAFEAALEADEKRVVFEGRHSDDSVILLTENTFLDQGQFRNGIIKTRKKDIDYHGYGLENIRDSVKKYNSIMDIDIGNNRFRMMILLQNSKESVKGLYETSNYR